MFCLLYTKRERTSSFTFKCDVASPHHLGSLHATIQTMAPAHTITHTHTHFHTQTYTHTNTASSASYLLCFAGLSLFTCLSLRFSPCARSHVFNMMVNERVPLFVLPHCVQSSHKYLHTHTLTHTLTLTLTHTHTRARTHSRTHAPLR